MTDIPLRCPEGESYDDFQANGIRYALQRYKTLIADEPGLGKGHPLTTRLATPDGFRPLGDLDVGDEVLGTDGRPTRITAIHDRGVIPVYRVTTNDGASVLVDGDHLWAIYDEVADDFHAVDTSTIMMMVDQGERPILPVMTAPATFRIREVPLDPVHAGLALISDAFAEDIDFDPQAYIEASPSQRMAFLSAILRKVGRVRGEDRHLRVMIKPGPRQDEAVHAITQIVRSLGGLCFRRITTIRKRGDALTIYLPDDIWLPLVGYTAPRRNIGARWKNFQPGIPDRTIESVKLHGMERVRCISVAARDELYLTEDFLLTHNTVSALGLSNNLPRVDSMLIICLASHKIHWKRAVERWDMHMLSVGIAEGDFFPDTQCVIINYDILHRHEEVLREGKWHVMIVDEAHYLGNEEARRTIHVFGGTVKKKVPYERNGKKKSKLEKQRVKPIEAEREVYLTGTPIPNRVKNIWPLVSRCDPKGLGRNREAFAYRYCGAFHDFNGLWDNGSSNLPELNRLLKERFMVRHLKKDVLKDLPPKTRQVIPLSSKGLDKKLAAERDALMEVLRQYEAQEGISIDADADTISSIVMGARPKLFDDYAKECDGEIDKDTPLSKLAIARQELALAKVPMAIEHIQNLIDQGEKVIVFAYHRAVIEALRDRWHNSCALIYGGTPTHKRQAEADRFQEDEFCNPFIGQYTAAGTGYTLTAARIVVCVELTWLPHEMSQSEDRAHRRGQTENVLVHHLIVEGSLDDGLLTKIVEKQEVIDEALN